MNAIIKVEDINTEVDSQPRMLDLRLAEALGFAKVYKIRELIKRHEDGLKELGDLVFPTAGKTSKGGRPTTECWLNEEQCLYLCSKSETEKATAVTIQMVKVFAQVMRGNVVSGEKNDKLTDIVQARVARERRLFLKQTLGLAKMAGLRDSQALIAANRATRNQTGYDFLSDMGLKYLEAPEQESLINASTIGNEIGGWSAIKVNQFLQEHGYQVGKRDKKDRGYWEPTQKGIDAGAQMVDVERSNKTGQSRQLLWASSIVDVIQDIIDEGAA